MWVTRSRYQRDMESWQADLKELASALEAVDAQMDDREPASRNLSWWRVFALRLLVFVYAPFCMAVPTIAFSAYSGLVVEVVPALAQIGFALYLIFVGPAFNEMEGVTDLPIRDTALKAGAAFTALTATVAALASDGLDGHKAEFAAAALFSTATLALAPLVYRHEKSKQARAEPRSSTGAP